MGVTYLETGSLNPYYNLAFEELVLTTRTRGDYLLLWQNRSAVVIGCNQNAEAEINRSFVEAHGIDVVRRTTGGGAVYHDTGNLNYSFITDAADGKAPAMERFSRPVADALKLLGLDAQTSGRNDILVAGRKVSGTAQRLHRGRALHHGTLLFDSNADMLSGALNASPEKLQAKGVKSVKSRVGNIRSFLKRDMDIAAFWAFLKDRLAGEGFVTGRLTEAELSEVEALKIGKYDTWEWNFGRSPRCDLTNRRKWDGGILEPVISLDKGRISGITFYGDFLAVSPLDGLTEALAGCAFQRSDVERVLDRFPLSELFGTITKGEVLDTIFY